MGSFGGFSDVFFGCPFQLDAKVGLPVVNGGLGSNPVEKSGMQGCSQVQGVAWIHIVETC
jgi:hypothetical protein